MLLSKEEENEEEQEDFSESDEDMEDFEQDTGAIPEEINSGINRSFQSWNYKYSDLRLITSRAILRPH